MRITGSVARAIGVTALIGLCLSLQAGSPSAAKVAPLPPPQAEVRIGEKIDNPEWADTLLTLARDMVAIYETKVAPVPPTGRKPFVIVQSNDGMPRANYGGDRYNVILTVTKSGPYHTQASFQLGHELGHFWTGSSDWYLESFCTALGFMCMDELHKQWTYYPKGKKWAGWAADMKDYHDKRNIQRYLKSIGLTNMNEAFEWARTKAPALIREGKFGRDEEGVLAAVTEQVLRRHPGQWAAMTRLNEVPKNPLDFQKWYSLVTPKQRPLVADLAAACGAPIAK